MLDVAALLVTLTAVFSYINHRYVRLPTTIGVMAIALVLSVVLIVASALGFGSTEQQLETLLRRLDFNFVLMKGMLSFLLFAGALHIDLEELKKRKWPIAILATFGVVFSTFAIGAATRFVLGALGMELDWIYCLLFGALISPTDPIAVLGILKSAGAPKGLEIKIAGESLFNDGVAVVVFLVLARIAAGVDPTVASVAGLFFEEVVGGILFGLTIGYIAFRMLRSIDNYQVEVMITLALVLGGYALASAIHVSGPLAMVVAGLLIGNTGRSFAMSATTQEHLDMFWELVDEILNGILFMLIGFELVVLSLQGRYLLAGGLLVPVVLLVRFISVGAPFVIMRRFMKLSPHAIKVLTWGGIRGGISVALALALPESPERQLVLTMTYVIVLFSIMVQGLTLGRLVRSVTREA